MTQRGLAAGVARWFGREPVLDFVGWDEFTRRAGQEHADVTREQTSRSITASIPKTSSSVAPAQRPSGPDRWLRTISCHAPGVKALNVVQFDLGILCRVHGPAGHPPLCARQARGQVCAAPWSVALLRPSPLGGNFAMGRLPERRCSPLGCLRRAPGVISRL
jgi:hypothetical protein